MRIGIDARLFINQRAGVANHLFNILCQWEQMGIEDKIFLYADKEINWPYNNPRWTLRTDMPKPIILGPISKPKLYKDILKTAYFGLWAMKDKVDIFWSPHPISPFFLPIRKVVTVHDLVWKYYPETMNEYTLCIYRFFADRSIHHAEQLFAVSESTRRDLYKFFPFKRNIVLTENAADEHFIPVVDVNKALEELGERYGICTPYILSVATIEPRKNLEGLLRAYKIFLEETSAPHRLVLVGMDGWKMTAIVSLLNHLGLKDRVVFTGYVPDEDLPIFYSCAAFLVYPSFYEGFGMPPLEAMACGCPVIVSNRPAMSEIAGDAALFIDPEDILDIADKMKSLFNNDVLTKILKDKGLERIRQYSWRRTAELIYRTLKKVEK